MDKKNMTIALPQIEKMPLRSKRAKKRSKAMTKDPKKISLKSFAITVIEKVTTPEIARSQKTSCSLGNFHVSDCKPRV